MSRRKDGGYYSPGFAAPVTGRFTGTRSTSYEQIKADGHRHDPGEYEGSHDPELTGSMTRREHFDHGTHEEPFWGSDPFKGIPGAHGELDQPF